MFASMYGFLVVPVWAGGINITVAEAFGFAFAIVRTRTFRYRQVRTDSFAKLDSNKSSVNDNGTRLSTKMLPVPMEGFYPVRSIKLSSLVREF